MNKKNTPSPETKNNNVVKKIDFTQPG
jgi:hypothetical protein